MDATPHVIAVIGDCGEMVIPSHMAGRMAPLNQMGQFDRRYRTAARDQRFANYLLRKLSAF